MKEEPQSPVEKLAGFFHFPSLVFGPLGVLNINILLATLGTLFYVVILVALYLLVGKWMMLFVSFVLNTAFSFLVAVYITKSEDETTDQQDTNPR